MQIKLLLFRVLPQWCCLERSPVLSWAAFAKSLVHKLTASDFGGNVMVVVLSVMSVGLLPAFSATLPLPSGHINKQLNASLILS